MEKDIKTIRDLKCPDLYLGESFEDGYEGCRVMVIGHQAPATDGEEDKFKNDRAQFEKEYKNNNIEIIQIDILEEGYKTWKKEERRRTNTWQKFKNIIYYPNKPALDSKEAKYLLQHIAFANYLTKPCFNKNRMGIDASEFYTNDLEAFKHYLDMAFKNNDKPNIVLVWGISQKGSYKYIKSCAESIIDDKYCILKNNNGATINVLNIQHPMAANQNDTHAKIDNLIKTLKEHALL